PNGIKEIRLNNISAKTIFPSTISGSENGIQLIYLGAKKNAINSGFVSNLNKIPQVNNIR
ncbi:hypothetical protein, partial [Bacillus paranthracis]|uniref:hypothetical protein n=1 Tax=Bacillus paranthracis TaxID=2026186 RepID=UPI001C638E01